MQNNNLPKNMGKKIADALKQQEVNEDKFDTLDVNTDSVQDTIN